MSDVPVCTRCGEELANDNWAPSRQQKNTHICKKCENAYGKEYRRNDQHNIKSKRLFSVIVERTNIYQYLIYRAPTDNIIINDTIKYNEYKTTPTNNKECSTYLGVNIAEEVLSKMFKNVVRMPYGNRGYDFICNKGMKIDSKSSTIHNNPNGLGRWMFKTNHNTIGDYFIFLAFDDRTHLVPLHIWMIPTEYFDGVGSASVSMTTLDKWDEYRLPLDKVVKCCDTLR